MDVIKALESFPYFSAITGRNRDAWQAWRQETAQELKLKLDGAQEAAEAVPLTPPTMLTLKQAATQTGLSESYLRRLCLEKKIVHVKAGVKYLINLERLIEYLNGGAA